MVAKAIQVPSYKEDSSSDSRSGENIYHHLSLIEDSTQKNKSAFTFSDSIAESFANDVISKNEGSPSFKSGVICTESFSSISNGNSKVSPTGSAGSDKYYALEDDYLNVNSGNGNAWLITILFGSKSSMKSLVKEKSYQKIMAFEQYYEQ